MGEAQNFLTAPRINCSFVHLFDNNYDVDFVIGAASLLTVFRFM